jgi:hypothetical protein
MTKLYIITWVLLLIFTLSCHDREDPCIYDGYNIYSPSDTTLYISFEIDGKKYKSYQYSGAGTDGGFIGGIEYNETKNLYGFGYSFSFKEFASDTTETSIYSWVYLEFLTYSMVDKSVSPLQFYRLSKSLKEETLKFTAPPVPPSIKDTSLMYGVAIHTGNMISSTFTVFKYFNYNIDAINIFFSDKSFFTISDIKPVCNNFNLLSGSFSTRLIINYEPLETINIENGQFSFLVKQ